MLANEQTPSAEAMRTPLALGSGSGGPSSPSPSSPSLLALRPLPPAAPSGFTCSLRFDSVVEMLYDDGWWLGTVLALVKPGAQEPIGAGIPQLDDGALVEGPHLRRLRRPLLARHGGEELKFLPSPPLPQEILFETSFACVGRKRGGQTSGRYID